MNKKIILDLCGGTGAWSKPYADAGYTVINITLPKYDVSRSFFSGDNLIFFAIEKEENLFVKINEVYGVLAAPPCTMFSLARTRAKKPRDFKSAMEAVKSCLQIIWTLEYQNNLSLKFWALENPMGHLRRFLGKPPFQFQPYDFGDRYSKKTCVWGNFNFPKKNTVNLTDEETIMAQNNTRELPPIPKNYLRDSGMRQDKIRRSITPQGFAQAFFKANQ